jgi:hypothetical protein
MHDQGPLQPPKETGDMALLTGCVEKAKQFNDRHLAISNLPVLTMCVAKRHIDEAGADNLVRGVDLQRQESSPPWCFVRRGGSQRRAMVEAEGL